MNYATRVRDLLEEYAAKSDGRIKLTITDPAPFSEEEDRAVAHGLQGIAINTSGERAYFGLVGANSIDTLETIPFFQTEKETALEYDITKLIYKLANPDKGTIGVITSLPLFGQAHMGMQGRGSQPWAIINVMREFFHVVDLGTDMEKIDDEMSVLLIVHPKDLGESTLFAIDQYLLRGGNAMLFIDPLSESDTAQQNPAMPMSVPVLDSNLKTILDGWGVRLVEGKIATDISLAMRVQTRGPRGPEEMIYLPWMGLDKANFNQQDFSTSELNRIHVGTAGIIEKQEDASITFEALIETTPLSMQIDSNRLLLQQDPALLLRDFTAEHKKQVLAARLSGKVSTAFADGRPNAAADEADTDSLKEGEVHVIVVADTDILSDTFWLRTQNFFGMEIPQTIADNGNFVINTLDNLSGNTDLVSLRSRGEFARPFTVVEGIRREAEEKFREREQQLQAKLEQTENKILALQQEGSDSNIILSARQAQEIEKFRHEQILTRKELRTVQHELQKNIDGLGTVLKFINIGLVPVLIALLAIFASIYRSRRRT